MQLPREVKIRIRPDGKVELETFGFVGKSCDELSTFLERLLAGENPSSEDVKRDLKTEYYLADMEHDLDQHDRET